jgi:hypothetical protein
MSLAMSMSRVIQALLDTRFLQSNWNQTMVNVVTYCIDGEAGNGSFLLLVTWLLDKFRG